MPRAHLRDPLQKNQQSVLPRLEKQGKTNHYKECLGRRSKLLQEAGGVAPPYLVFKSWSGQLLSDKHHAGEARLPTNSLAQDAPTLFPNPV